MSSVSFYSNNDGLKRGCACNIWISIKMKKLEWRFSDVVVSREIRRRRKEKVAENFFFYLPWLIYKCGLSI